MGHFHSDEYRLLESDIPGFCVPSFTPIFGNNPSYRVGSFDKSGKWLGMNDFTQVFTDIYHMASTGPTFQEEYSFSDYLLDSGDDKPKRINKETFKLVVDRIRDDPIAFASYLSRENVMLSPRRSSQTCVMLESDAQGFAACEEAMAGQKDLRELRRIDPISLYE